MRILIPSLASCTSAESKPTQACNRGVLQCRVSWDILYCAVCKANGLCVSSNEQLHSVSTVAQCKWMMSHASFAALPVVP